MIGLLNAGFLLGAAAVAVPIVIHLVHRRKSRIVDFPTLRFLREVDRRIARRRRIEELLLLAMRCAAIALLALALAKPLFRPTPTAGSGAATTAVIVLDDSLSMRAAERGADRFERAREAARTVLDTLRPGDSIALVRPGGGTTGPTTDLAAARRALEQARPSWGSKRMAFEAAAKLLAGATTPARELFVVGDVQRGSWAETPVKGDFDTFVLPVGASTPANATLAALDVLSPAASADVPARVRATVVNRSEKPQERTITFELDGRVVHQQRLALAGRGRCSVTAEIDLGGAGWHDVRARLDEDALPADDEALLALDARERMPVLFVGAGNGGYADDGFYLARALNPGGGAVDVSACRAEELRDFRLADFALVVCFVEPPADVMQYVAKGGSALVLGGDGAVERGAEAALTLRELDDRHPIFRRLVQGESPVDFGSAKFYRTVALEARKGDLVPARFSDGKPAIVERAHGSGRVIRLASGLTPAWTNFPLKVSFLPFVHSVVSYLAAGAGRERCRVGAALTLAYPSDAPSAVRLDGVEKPVAGGAVAFDAFAEPGIARLEELFAAGPRERRIAVNVDPDEGDLARGDPAALAGLFERGRVVEPESLGATLDKTRHGIELGWSCLLAALAVLLVEAWFSNRVAMGR